MFVVLLVLAAIILLANIAVKPTDEHLDLNMSLHGSIPIVYSENYNISFFGLEELHPFDTKKYGRVYDALRNSGTFNGRRFMNAAKPTMELLLTAHGAAYLETLNSARTLARITEVDILRHIPSMLARKLVLEPMLYQAGGSVLAARAALVHGWAINLGGGFHHASADNGEGFCALADIALVVKHLRNEKHIRRAMIIDLDAHQGNGHGRDFIDDADVYILDIYNKDVYPGEQEAKRGIDLKVELDAFTGDGKYLDELEAALSTAFGDFSPDIVIYIAGTDVLGGDPLGGLSLSADAVMKRDALVFEASVSRDIPIVMLLSGGYQKSTAAVIAKSILNLSDCCIEQPAP